MITRSCSSMWRSRNAIFVSRSWNDSAFIEELLWKNVRIAFAKLFGSWRSNSQLRSDPKDLSELNR